jgi:hypothetical protein
MAIVVVNTSDQPFQDRFNGVDYDFPPKKKVLLTEDAARHIFGLGEQDKGPYLARLGWYRTAADLDSAMARLGKFQFSAFDPYAQLNDDQSAEADAPSEDNEQRLSPVADDEAPSAVSGGADEGVDSTPGKGSKAKGGVIEKLQAAQE